MRHTQTQTRAVLGGMHITPRGRAISQGMDISIQTDGDEPCTGWIGDDAHQGRRMGCVIASSARARRGLYVSGGVHAEANGVLAGGYVTAYSGDGCTVESVGGGRVAPRHLGMRHGARRPTQEGASRRTAANGEDVGSVSRICLCGTPTSLPFNILRGECVLWRCFPG